MSLIQWGLVACAGFLILYGLLVLALVLAGRRTDARALAGFVPDCAVLFARLIRDPAVSRWRKLVLIPLAAYLALPFDLIPDFIPVAGQLDDALVVAFALRLITSGADASVIRRSWPGPENSLELVLRLAGRQGA
jgi:uncharacterized membrane protein YkvA (DUF1232 family)